jgi:transcription initiation factor TFIIB
VSRLNIPKYIHKTAWRIYVEVAKEKLTVGRSIDGFVAGSLYAAIRIHKFPKLLYDVADVALISNHALFRSLSLIINEILPYLGLEYHPMPVEKFIFAFGDKLGLPMNIKIEAMNTLKSISKRGLCVGKDPKGLAAAILYYIAKDTPFKKIQSEVAAVARVTGVTIRSRVKDIKKLWES